MPLSIGAHQDSSLDIGAWKASVDTSEPIVPDGRRAFRQRALNTTLRGPLMVLPDGDLADVKDKAHVVYIYVNTVIAVDIGDFYVYYRLYNSTTGAEIDGTQTHTSVLENENYRDNVSATQLVYLNAGDVIKVQARKSSNADTVQTIGNTSRILISRR